jgi:hypothetical protein
MYHPLALLAAQTMKACLVLKVEKLDLGSKKLIRTKDVWIIFLRTRDVNRLLCHQNCLVIFPVSGANPEIATAGLPDDIFSNKKSQFG